MRTSNLSRIVWKVSLPLIFVEATEVLDHLIDSVFLSRVGVTQLGAIGVADTVMLLFLIVPLSFVDGIQILTARRIGQRRPEAAGTVFNQGLLLVLLLGGVCTVTLKLFSSALVPWFVGSRSVAGAVDSYLQLDAYSIPLAGAAFAYSAVLTSLGRTRALVPATVILVLVDIALNYLFIFGKFGAPELGMRGAAVGSIGAELAATLFFTVYLKRKFGAQAYGFLQFRGITRRTVRLMSRIAAPIAGQDLLADVRWFLFFMIIERVGTEELAIANIVFTCYMVFLTPTEGFSETACSMVSRFVGGNRAHRIHEVVRTTIGGAVTATIPFILVAILAPHWLVAAFSTEANMLAQSSASLRIVALAMLIAIPGEIWYTAVVGTGDTAAALGIEFLLTLAMLGMTWFTAIHLGGPMALVWMSLPITWLLCLALSYGWMRSGIWRRLEL